MSTIRSWPSRIYLQREEREDYPKEAARNGDVTWCVDKINENDVEYVRIDLFNSLKARLKKGSPETVNDDA